MRLSNKKGFEEGVGGGSEYLAVVEGQTGMLHVVRKFKNAAQPFRVGANSVLIAEARSLNFYSAAESRIGFQKLFFFRSGSFYFIDDKKKFFFLLIFIPLCSIGYTHNNYYKISTEITFKYETLAPWVY